MVVRDGDVGGGEEGREEGGGEEGEVVLVVSGTATHISRWVVSRSDAHTDSGTHQHPTCLIHANKYTATDTHL